VNRLIGLGFAAVPQIALVPVQESGRRGNQDLPGALALGARVALQFPKQARLRHVHPERVLDELTPELNGEQAIGSAGCTDEVR
jgi:hypothetical protein